jgi:hypothetical protein
MTPLETSAPVVTISPVENELPDTIVVKPPTDTLTAQSITKEEINRVEKSHWGQFLLSAKQNIQSINLKKFMADRTFQVSLTPGLSTHGKLSAQVVNTVSVNVIGGYTAGVNGVELGGAFNINKTDVKYVQAAGLLNFTGGSVKGVQLAGLHNHVLGNVDIVQASGIANFVKGNVTGAQLAGVYNHVSKDVKGLQASGIANFVKGNATGAQMSSIYNHVAGSFTGFQASNISNFVYGKFVGVQLSNIYNVCYDSLVGVQATNIINFAHKQVYGAQLSVVANVATRDLNGAQIGLFNYAKKLRGFQLGLINVADTSDGYSLGLINIVFKGYHKIAFSTNETMRFNAAFKTGNSKLYSILLMGFDQRKIAEDSANVFSLGYGLGHEFSLGKWFSINPEFTAQYLYLGSYNSTNVLSKLHLQFQVKFGKYFSIFAGPSFTTFYSDQTKTYPGWNYAIPSSGYHTFELWSHDVRGWIGWNAGISIF